MSKINGIDPWIVPQSVNPAPASKEQAQTAKAEEPPEVATISSLADLAAKARELPDVRSDLVERVKAEIAQGDYDTPERIEAASQGLLNDLLGDI